MVEEQAFTSAVGSGARQWTADEELLCLCDPHSAPLDGSDPARIARIQAETSAGFTALAGVHKAVSFFGSARTPPGHPDRVLARRLAARLGADGFSVITGGGPGVMEAANQGARDVGATSIGLTIELPHEQLGNPYLDISVPFHYFFVRKLMFIRYASAFVVFPGGFGTLDELFEALTLIQTGKIRHFPLVLVGRDHWGGLIAWVRERLLETGLVASTDLDLLLVSNDIEEISRLVRICHARQREDALPARPGFETATPPLDPAAPVRPPH